MYLWRNCLTINIIYLLMKGSNMKIIDLHVHSTMSDGTYTPTELIELADRHKIAALTVSDHDTIDGLDEAEQAVRDKNVEFIPGMEVSVDYMGRTIHVVALGFTRTAPAFLKLYKNIRYHKEMGMEEVIAEINKMGVDITMEKVQPFVHNGHMERYAIMRYLKSLSITEKLQGIWDKYINPTIKKLGLDKNVEIGELAEGIHQSGGVISLAHFHKLIGLKGLNRLEQERAIKELHESGLDGMEKYYSNYSEDDKAFAAKMIEKYDLLPTGGSDFHGKNRPGVELATGIDNNLAIPYTIYENILRHCKKV